jgi:hypothetical protein
MEPGFWNRRATEKVSNPFWGTFCMPTDCEDSEVQFPAELAAEIQELRQAMPPIFSAKHLPRYSKNSISPRTVLNKRALGIQYGPECFCYVGREVGIRRDNFLRAHFSIEQPAGNRQPRGQVRRRLEAADRGRAAKRGRLPENKAEQPPVAARKPQRNNLATPS